MIALFRKAGAQSGTGFGCRPCIERAARRGQEVGLHDISRKSGQMQRTLRDDLPEAASL
jgi:hypothetical protein